MRKWTFKHVTKVEKIVVTRVNGLLTEAKANGDLIPPVVEERGDGDVDDIVCVRGTRTYSSKVTVRGILWAEARKKAAQILGCEPTSLHLVDEGES